MSEIAERSAPSAAGGSSFWSDAIRKEDWWAIWIGLGLVVVAAALFANGQSLKWIAIAPQKWSHLSQVGTQLQAHWLQYLSLLVLWSVLFGIAAAALGIRVSRFLVSFALIYVVALALYFLGLWDQASRYNLEPPLVALALGLLVANTLGVPKWADAGLRVEFYVKTGIVLLGTSLPLTLIAWAGPVAIVQAAIVSLVTFGVIYLTAVRLGLDRRLAAVLGTGGAVCGVSGAIAVGGAVGAKRQDVSVAISLVVAWAIVMIYALPLVSRALGLSTGVAGAWIGTSEFADAAGLAAAQTYGGYAGHLAGIAGSAQDAVNAFTLMKVIGRDLWIGIWAFVLSVIAVSRWDATGIDSRAGAGQIWQRFPKFVIGFVLASALITLLAAAYGPAAFNKVLKPEVVAPIKTLRTWAFTFCFLSIGLTLRWRELAGVGLRPFIAFSSGVVVNVLLGFLLSAVVFGGYWAALGAP